MNGDTAATAAHAAEELQTRTALARAQSNSNHDDNFEPSAGAHNPRATKDGTTAVKTWACICRSTVSARTVSLMAAASLPPRRPNLQNNHISKQ